MDDDKVRQYAAEWEEVKPSVQRLAELEQDLSEFLNTVNQMSDVGSIPGQEANAAQTAQSTNSVSANLGQYSSGQYSAQTSEDPITKAGGSGAAVGSVTNAVPQDVYTAFTGAGALDVAPALCKAPVRHMYKKSLGVVARFPRMKPNSSTVGGLESVEAHLPLLLASMLIKHDGLMTPRPIHEGFSNALDVKRLAEENRIQFMLSGEVDDLSVAFPNEAPSVGMFDQMISRAHDLFNLRTSMDKRKRVFSFKLNLHDGITGQVMFTKQYTTYGEWDLPRVKRTGFGSIEFWRTGYGQKVKSLVEMASNELAHIVRCQPYFAKVDALPDQQQVVIYSGKDSGIRPGDTLELYRIAQQVLPGQYDQPITRLIKEVNPVYITETYPAHSIAQVASTSGLRGRYVVGAH